MRTRIPQALFDADPLTTGRLRERLPDIAQATMYRHVAVPAEGGVPEVVGEKRVRGAVERGYRVRGEEAVVDPAARAAMTRDDHERAFTAFAASLTGTSTGTSPTRARTRTSTAWSTGRRRCG